MSKFNSCEIYPFGFQNLGVTCYFNSLIQSFLSCPSFIDEFKDDSYVSNPISNLFTELIKLSRIYNTLVIKNKENPEILNMIDITKSKLNEFGSKIFITMINYLANKKKIDNRSFMSGMRCVGEGYNYLLESMEEFSDMQKLFVHKYKSLIRCMLCNKWVSKTKYINNIFIIEPNLRVEQLDKFKNYNIQSNNMRDFLLYQTEYIDNDYKCPECKTNDERLKVNKLIDIPKIMVIMSKKYNATEKLNILTEFPENMEFTSVNTGIISKYEAVAQIEHVGDLHGGHYWAICKRMGVWYNINDINVSYAEFKPTINTYLVFYQLL